MTSGKKEPILTDKERSTRPDNSLVIRALAVCYNQETGEFDMLDKVYVVHFSPAGNTRKAALMLAGELAAQVEEYDLTLPSGERRCFAPSDVVIAAGPVYGGRLPGVMAERLSRVQGNGAWFISLAVYGNRAYEDALIELDDRMEQQGFSRLASAALIAQHSIITQLAAGRPDEQDRREIAAFAGEILHKLSSLAEGKKPEEKATPETVPIKTGSPCRPSLRWQRTVSGAASAHKNVPWKPYPQGIPHRRIRESVFCACGALPSVRKKREHCLRR